MNSRIERGLANSKLRKTSGKVRSRPVSKIPIVKTQVPLRCISCLRPGWGMVHYSILGVCKTCNVSLDIPMAKNVVVIDV